MSVVSVAIFVAPGVAALGVAGVAALVARRGRRGAALVVLTAAAILAFRWGVFYGQEAILDVRWLQLAWLMARLAPLLAVFVLLAGARVERAGVERLTSGG